MSNNRPKIGLALGSGGSRGLAHIGIIKVLEKNGIKIDYIAGSSIGALVGGFYASGMNAKTLEDMALATDWKLLFSLVDPHLGQGFLNGGKVKFFIENYVNSKKIENCNIPFAAISTNLKTGEPVIFTKGEISTAVRASISVPLVFKPVELNRRMLADGGLSIPVPAEIVRKMGADIVIGVNLDKHIPGLKNNPTFADIADGSLSILRHHLSQSNMSSADIKINIDVGRIYWYEFLNGKSIIKAGEKAAEKMLPELLKLLEQKQARI